jgi:hypothetical protein
MTSDTVLVRLRPYDKRRGCVLRSLTVFHMRFLEKRGWYEVEREMAEMLRPFKQPPYGEIPPELTPLAFEIREKDEAIAIEEEEERIKLERAKAASPHKLATPPGLKGTLTTADLEPDGPEIEVSDTEPPPRPPPPAKRSSRGRRKRASDR